MAATEQPIYAGSRGNPYHKCWFSEKFRFQVLGKCKGRKENK